MADYNEFPTIIRTKGSREEKNQKAAPRSPQPAQNKKPQDPVSLLQQQMLGVKGQFNQIKSQLGELKNLRNTQEEQARILETLQDGQKSLTEALNEIAKAMDEFLQNSRPEGSEAAQTVAQRVLDLEDQVDQIWEAVEKLEKHTGLNG